MNKAYLGFGSNIGNGRLHVKKAWQALSLVPGVTPLRISSFYKTAPWGYTDQPDFINACAEIETSLSPEALLGVCLGIEAGLGRVRAIKDGPRVIDIDLLLYSGETRDTDELTLPHPRMWQRRFVLDPLYEITAGTPLGDRVKEAIAALPDE